MALVPISSQSSSSIKVRLGKLQNLYKALTKKDKSDQDISQAFASLHKIDQDAIRQKISIQGAASTKDKQKKQLISVVEGQIQTLSQSNVRDVFQTVAKQSRNPLAQIPVALMTTTIRSFLTQEEMSNLQVACVGYSSLTASRYHRLNDLSLAIAKDSEKVPVLFRNLHQADQAKILAKFDRESFDWVQMKEYKEALLKEIEVIKAERSFTTPSSKSLVNHMQKIPFGDVMSSSLGSFLVPKDMANLRASFKGAAAIDTASLIIKTYHLDCLIETYVHRSCSELTESEKTKALHELICMAKDLSEIEKLPKPSYLSLSLHTLFQQVEARNLIRMMAKIHQAHPLPDLPKDVNDLTVPIDAQRTVLKAERLRRWMQQHKEFLAAIDHLGFSGCNLSLLPKEIGQLKALRKLGLDSNHLVCIPKEIGQLKALRELWLNNNHLTSLSKELGQLKVLRDLWLDSNHLVCIPKEIGQLKALRILWLGYNCLASIPKELGQLKVLQDLRLNNNHLASLPKELGQLSALLWLSLGYNCIASLPKEFGQLKVLRDLCLDSNRLASIPKEIGKLKDLETFSLDINGLIDIPDSLSRFSFDLRNQNKQLQLKTILNELSFCVAGSHDIKRIINLLNVLEKLIGRETNKQLHRCLYELAKEAEKTDKSLHDKLKDPQFARKAFVDPTISPKLKAAAIERFRKNLEKQAVAKK